MMRNDPSPPEQLTDAIGTPAASPQAGLGEVLNSVLTPVLDSVLDAVLLLDVDGSITFANSSVERVFGYLPSELVGRSVDVLVPAEHRAAHEGHRNGYLGDPAPRPMGPELSLEGVRQDGSRFPAQISLAPLTTPEGRRVTAVVRDVTAVHELADSRRHLAMSHDVARLASWEHDDVTGKGYWSPAFHRMFGFTPGEVDRGLEAIRQRVHADDLPALDAEYRRVLGEGGRTFAVIRTADAARTYAVRGSVELDGRGRVVRSIGTVQDITDVTQLQRALDSATSRFRATFDRSPIGMALIDVRPGHPVRRLMVNQALVDLLDLPAERLLAEPLPDRIHPDDRAAFQRQLDALACGTSDTVQALEVRILCPHGRPAWAAFSATLVRDATGVPEYVVAHVQDITDRRKAEKVMRDVAARDARIASVLQDDLVPLVSQRVGPILVASRYLPAGNGELVGGDWTDVFALPGGRIGIVVGDVAGHGVQAAATMSRLRVVVRMLATSGLDPAGVLRRINDAVHETDLTADIDLATLVHAQLDPATGVLRYSSAGHLPMIILPAPGQRGAGIAVPVPSVGGPPIGVVPGFAYLEDAAELAPGNRLICYTDGLIERPGDDLDESFLLLLHRLGELAPDVAADVEKLADAVLSPSRHHARRDDIAVMVLSFEPTLPRPTADPEPARGPRRRPVDQERWIDLDSRDAGAPRRPGRA